ncbi:MAG: hypothetical protein U9N85_07300 [Bacteroidota bacterium]|nr:hypothetical protein [Bacteroidota bacterium]
MKKFTLIISAFVLFSVILTSCNKDEDQMKPDNQPKDLTEQKILNFKAKMKNNPKSGETFSIDSAVWYIEALANYENCIYENEEDAPIYNLEYHKSISYPISVKNNKININAVTTSYNQLNEFVTHTFNKFSHENKVNYLIDVEYTGDSLLFQTVIHYAGPQLKPSDFDRAWMWHDCNLPSGTGDCDGNFIGERSLVTEILAYYYGSAGKPHKTGYYTGIDKYNWSEPTDPHMWDTSNPSPFGYGSPLYQELYIVEEQPFFEWCVLEEHCEWYADNFSYALELAHEEYDPVFQYTGKSFISFDLRAWEGYFEGSSTPYRIHRIDLIYGEYHSSWIR